MKDIKTFFREKETVFWTIAFPVIILLLFTAIFGREVPFTANIGIVDSDNTPLTSNMISAFNDTEIFNVEIFKNKTQALEARARYTRRFSTNPLRGWDSSIQEMG